MMSSPDATVRCRPRTFRSPTKIADMRPPANFGGRVSHSAISLAATVLFLRYPSGTPCAFSLAPPGSRTEQPKLDARRLEARERRQSPMPRKPNYRFERNERERLKAEKKKKRSIEKMEAQAAKDEVSNSSGSDKGTDT